VCKCDCIYMTELSWFIPSQFLMKIQHSNAQNYEKYNSHPPLHTKHCSYSFWTLPNKKYISTNIPCILLLKSCLPLYCNNCLSTVKIHSALVDVQILTSLLVAKNCLLVCEQGEKVLDISVHKNYIIRKTKQIQIN
jgi:hypothetical protein